MIARNPRPALDASPASPTHLLTDEQMRRFIATGFLALNAGVPRSVHETIYKGLSAAMEAKNSGNNTLPQVPELQQVFDSPVARGALTSVLGPGYIMHQHRHTHYNAPGGQGGGWHRDSYWGYHPPFRGHRPWWAMIMYFPQDTPITIGPTAVLPGAFTWESRMPEHEKRQHAFTGEAGTFALIHFDLWHAALPNTGDQFRHMCKFQFVRMETPKAPTWNNQDKAWIDPPESQWPHYPQRALWRSSWDWYAGRKPGASVKKVRTSEAQLARLIETLRSGDDRARVLAADELGARGPGASGAMGALIAALDDAFEPVRLNACYALASLGASAIPALKQVLFNSPEPRFRLALYALAGIGDEADPVLLEAAGSDVEVVRVGAAFALGLTHRPHSVRPAVLETLARLAADPAYKVRYAAIDSLGQIGKTAAAGVPVLIDRLRDAEAETRFNAALALARIGPAAAEAVPQLKSMFLDSNRYVRGYVIEALHRIGTRDALEAAINQLKGSRWCPITAMDQHFYP